MNSNDTHIGTNMTSDSGFTTTTPNILVVVDMQNDFVTGLLGNNDAKAALDGCVKLCESGEFQSIVFTRDTHQRYDTDSIERKRLPVEHCIRDTDGWKIVPELARWVLPDESNVVNKLSFASLGGLSAAIESAVRTSGDMTGTATNGEIHFCGVCTSICVLSNMAVIRSAFPCARLVLHKNATGDVSGEAKLAAFRVLQSLMCDVED